MPLPVLYVAGLPMLRCKRRIETSESGDPLGHMGRKKFPFLGVHLGGVGIASLGTKDRVDAIELSHSIT